MEMAIGCQRLGRQDRRATAYRHISAGDCESEHSDNDCMRDSAFDFTPPQVQLSRINVVTDRISDRLFEVHRSDDSDACRWGTSTSRNTSHCLLCPLDFVPPQVQSRRANVATESLSDIAFATGAALGYRYTLSSLLSHCVPPQLRLRRANVATDCISDRIFEKDIGPPSSEDKKSDQLADIVPPPPPPPRASHATLRRDDETRTERRSRDDFRRQMHRWHRSRSGVRPRCSEFSAMCGDTRCGSSCRTGSQCVEVPHGFKPSWMMTAGFGFNLSTAASAIPSVQLTPEPLQALMPGSGWPSARPLAQATSALDALVQDIDLPEGRLMHELDLPLGVQAATGELPEDSVKSSLDNVLPDVEVTQRKKKRWPRDSRVCKDCRPLLLPRRGLWLKYCVCEHRRPKDRAPMPFRSDFKTLRQTDLARVRRGERPKCRKNMKRRRCIHFSVNCKLCHGCEHGNLRYRCAKCRPCPHGVAVRNCSICTECIHELHKERCVVCSACPHGSLRSSCLICSGCPHGKLRSGCRECSGCPHGRLLGNCPACRGCVHGRLMAFCADCTPCEHGRARLSCGICWGCPHGLLRRFCSTCTPCPHGRRREHCVECSGCEHGFVKSDCRHCSGCPHGRVKRFCVSCNPCPHGKRKQSCLKCSACPHGRIADACHECKGCPHGLVRRFCRFCNGCPHGRLQRFCRLCRGLGRATGRGRSAGRSGDRVRGDPDAVPSDFATKV